MKGTRKRILVSISLLLILWLAIVVMFGKTVYVTVPRGSRISINGGFCFPASLQSGNSITYSCRALKDNIDLELTVDNTVYRLHRALNHHENYVAFGEFLDSKNY